MTINTSLASVGERFLIGVRPGLELAPEDRRLLKDLQPAGIVLFKKNFAHGEPYEFLVRHLDALIREARSLIIRPHMIVALDHEGGRVFRLPPPFSNFGPACEWGARAREVGRAFAAELLSLGVNLNFAPVLDVNSNPLNPVIGDRAFSMDAEEVGIHGIALMKGLSDGGVLCCGKHFPGHGDADADSHFVLPTIRADLETLRKRELVPFRMAIEANIPMIMSAHLMVPAIDAKYPSTRSAALGSLLRNVYGFRGVYITDDLGMQAVQADMLNPDFAPAVARAGHDMFMMCAAWGDTSKMYPFAEYLLKGIEHGAVEKDAWAASGLRIAELVGAASNAMPRVHDFSMFDTHSRLLAS